MAKFNWYKTGKENRISKQGYEFLKSDPLPTQPDNILKPKKKKAAIKPKYKSQPTYKPPKKKKKLKTCPICKRKFRNLSGHIGKCLSEYKKTKTKEKKSKAKSKKGKLTIQKIADLNPNHRVKRYSKAFLLSIKNKNILTGSVIGENKGGYIIKFNVVRGFCPHSHMYPDGERLSYYKSLKNIEFRIIEATEFKLIVSRKLIVKEIILNHLKQVKKEGKTATVTVENIQNFGLFVSYGVVYGLVHKSNLPKLLTNDMKNAFRIGQELDVKVIKINKNDERVTFSML